MPLGSPLDEEVEIRVGRLRQVVTILPSEEFMIAAVRDFDIGERVRVPASFTTLEGTPVDPATVTFKLKRPGGSPSPSVTAYVYGVNGELEKDEVGYYHIDIDFNAEGYWYLRWESSGTWAAAYEMSVYVRRSAF